MNSANLRSALVEALDQGVALLADMAPSQYTEPVPSAFNASVGSHFRHCLDHFETLLAGADANGLVDYDARQRDQLVEKDCEKALARAREIRTACENLSDETFDREVTVRCKVSCATNNSPVVQSTFGREAMYTIVHAIHHYALINVMCDILRVETPKNFGIAPSTIAHHEEQVDLTVQC